MKPRTRGEGKRSLAIRAAILDILAGFDGPMSGRQVYYQCVSRGAVPNGAKYCRAVLQRLVAMRRDGSVPYSRIVDRNRAKHQRPGWAGIEEIMGATAEQFRRNYWAEADAVPMIACEKAALEGIFSQACDQYGAALYTVRGFNSESFEYEWAEDIKRITAEGREVHVYYFGDFDPSGLDIERNSHEKLLGFGARFEWTRVGLLESDFAAFDLVPLPVKRTDSRAKRFLIQFGDRGAELDALPPAELEHRIRYAIERHVDVERWNALLRADAAERESLALVAGNWTTALAAVRGAA